jgi:transcriptional regulator with XRE-family HTH domain
MKTPLYKCRIAEGITSGQLAAAINSSNATVSRLERGSTKNTSGAICLLVLNRYAHLGLTLEHLIHPENFPDFIVKE